MGQVERQGIKGGKGVWVRWGEGRVYVCLFISKMIHGHCTQEEKGKCKESWNNKIIKYFDTEIKTV